MSKAAGLALSVLMLAACQTPDPAAHPLPLPFQSVGDDGLTQRFAAGMVTALQASNRVVLVTDARSGLILRNRMNVTPLNDGTDRFRYAVDLYSNVRIPLQSCVDICAESAIANCTTRVVRQLEAYLREHPPGR